MAGRACKGKTKVGKPCKAPPLQPGTEIEGVIVKGRYCRAHDPILPASVRFGSRAQASAAGERGGRPTAPRMVDIIRERLEAELDQWWAVLKDAANAEAPYTVGYGEDAYVEMVPDHRTRLLALREVLDRSYGKPTQSTEITGAAGGPIETREVPTDANWHTQVAQVLAEAEAAKAPSLNGSNGSGPDTD